MELLRMAVLYIPNVKLCIGAITVSERCVLDSVEWPYKLKSKLMSLQALEITEGICSQVENARQSSNESLTQRTRALSFSSTVLYAEVRYGSLHTISERKPEGHGLWPHRAHLRSDALYYRKGNSVLLSLILPFKHSWEIKHPKCLMKIKLLTEMLGFWVEVRDFTFMQTRKPTTEMKNRLMMHTHPMN